MWEPRHLTTLWAFRACYRDSFTSYLREIGWGGMDWIDLAWDRDSWRALENSNEPLGSIKCREILEWLCDWQLLKKGSAPWS
jgi:hypothetical protein